MIAYILVLIMSTSPTINAEVTYQFDTLADCKAARRVILTEEPDLVPRLKCWKVVTE